MTAGYSTTLLCTQCHKPFHRKPSRARKLKLGFCSRLCKKTYQQDIPARFWEKVLKKGHDECWSWEGAVGSGGYGSVHITENNQSKTIGAHILAYRLQFGPVPTGLHVLHSCDVPLCMNGAHFFTGTNADNVHDRHRKGRTSHASRNRGEEQWKSKLIITDILSIRYMRQKGVSRKDVAQIYSVHPVHISSICSGRRWKHVGRE